MKIVIKIKDYVIFILTIVLHISILVGVGYFGYIAGKTFAINHSDTYLEVSTITPALLRGKVEKTPILRIGFTEKLNIETVKNSNFFIREGNFRIPISIKYNDLKKMITIIPEDELENGKEYSLHISNGILSTNKHRLKKSIIKDFVVKNL